MVTLTHAELGQLLDCGRYFLRSEAQQVLAQAEEFLTDLLLALQGKKELRVYAAAVLLGALADPRAVPGLLGLMSHPEQDLRDLASESLARIGEAALEAILPLESYAAACCLGALGQFHPSLRPRVAARLIELLSGPEGITAAYGLADMDWQDAIPFIEANMDGPHWDRDSFYEEDVARWRAGTYQRDEPEWDPLHWLALDHEIELQRYLRDLDRAQAEQFSSTEFSVRFTKELDELRPAVRTVVRLVQAGRNDPCPCGSGKKYKKCCLEADQSLGKLGPLEARLQNLEWPFHGYRLTPKEQLAQLPEAEVLAHLDILRMPLADLRARLAGEANDYLRWAGAHRFRLLGKLEEAQEAALSVALADGGHPALNYGEVAVLALNEVRHSRRRTPMFRLALQQGILIDAIYEAQELLNSEKKEQGFEAFEEILRASPQPLWTVAALADAVPWHLSARALPIVERAAKEARSGHTRAHPLLPERPCPAWILAGYAAELRQRAAHWHQLDLRLEESNLHPIDDEPRGIFFHLRDEEWKLSRTRPDDYAERLAELHARAARGLNLILASTSPTRRKGVLVGQAADGLVWVAPSRSDEAPRWREHAVLDPAPDYALQALLRAAGEEGKATLRVREGSWGGWRAYLVPDPSTDFSELASVALSEICEELPDPAQWQTVDADWPHLRALGGDELLAAEVEAAPEPELPPAEGEDLLQVYLKRILTRLLRMNKVGAAHTELAYFFRGVPAQWRGELKEILDLLIADGYIRLKPTLKSPHISLEPRRLPAIKQYLDGGPVPPGKLADHLFEVSSSRV